MQVDESKTVSSVKACLVPRGNLVRLPNSGFAIRIEDNPDMEQSSRFVTVDDGRIRCVKNSTDVIPHYNAKIVLEG